MARGWLKAFGLAASGAVLLPAAGLLHAAGRVSPCDRPELTASIGDSQPGAAASTTPDRMTIVLVGDTGFNPTDTKSKASLSGPAPFTSVRSVTLDGREDSVTSGKISAVGVVDITVPPKRIATLLLAC